MHSPDAVNNNTEMQALVIDGMCADIITVTVKGDELILAYGSFHLLNAGMRKVNNYKTKNASVGKSADSA